MKVPCVYCKRKFHKKGIFSHQARCKAIPPAVEEGQVVEHNFTNLSPHARLIKAANEFYESLYDHQKLEAVASILK
jgi:hypothetical protein